MKLVAVFNKHTVTYSPGWTLTPTHYCRNACGYSAYFVERKGARSATAAGSEAPRHTQYQRRHARAFNAFGDHCCLTENV